MNSFQKSHPKIYKGLVYGGNALKVAHQAYNMAKVVAAIVNSEKKYFDTNPSSQIDHGTPYILGLTQMAQGDTNITRNGNTIALKSLQATLQLKFDPLIADEVIRVVIFRDNDNNSGTAPTVSDIYENPDVLSLRNKNTPKRFTILYDKTYTSNTSNTMKIINYYKKFPMQKDAKGNPTRSVKAYFDGTAATDSTRGHIYLYVMGNIPTGTTLSSIYGYTRLRYYDN